MQQAKEVFVLSKYQKSAPQLSVALREGKKRPNQDIVTGLRMMPLVIWYRVPLPADPIQMHVAVRFGFTPYHKQGPAFDPAGALNLQILNFIMAGSLPVFLFGCCWFTEAKHTGSGLLSRI